LLILSQVSLACVDKIEINIEQKLESIGFQTRTVECFLDMDERGMREYLQILKSSEFSGDEFQLTKLNGGRFFL